MKPTSNLLCLCKKQTKFGNRLQSNSNKFFNEILVFELEQLNQCFPKFGPRTIFGPQEFLFWSARKKKLTVMRKSVLKSIILGHLVYKTVRNQKKLKLWSAENFLSTFWSAKFFFQCFLVCKLKKFGKHWLNAIIQLKLSACLCPKAITLSGFLCICKKTYYCLDTQFLRFLFKNN